MSENIYEVLSVSSDDETMDEEEEARMNELVSFWEKLDAFREKRQRGEVCHHDADKVIHIVYRFELLYKEDLFALALQMEQMMKEEFDFIVTKAWDPFCVC